MQSRALMWGMAVFVAIINHHPILAILIIVIALIDANVLDSETL